MLMISGRRSQVKPSCQVAMLSAISPSGMSSICSTEVSPSRPSGLEHPPVEAGGERVAGTLHDDHADAGRERRTDDPQRVPGGGRLRVLRSPDGSA